MRIDEGQQAWHESLDVPASDGHCRFSDILPLMPLQDDS